MTDLLALCEPTYAERVAALFRSRPNEWIHWSELARVGGALAWRSRCSECHTQFGMMIEHKIIRRADGVKESFRRYVPKAKGIDANL